MNHVGEYFIFPFTISIKRWYIRLYISEMVRVYFTEENAQKMADNPSNTTLTSLFFKTCKNDPFTKTLLYSEEHVKNMVFLKTTDIGRILYLIPL